MHLIKAFGSIFYKKVNGHRSERGRGSASILARALSQMQPNDSPMHLEAA